MSATISSPLILAAAVVLALIVIAFLFHSRLPSLAKAGLGLAALLLACAAGGLSVQWPRTANVVVMVDLSPSTRTATYRDSAALRARIEQLLPGVAHRQLFFAREEASDGDVSIRSSQDIQDIAVDETKFSPPSVDAVVLLSDGQFSLPANSPPVFAGVDPGIVKASDASIHSVEIRDSTAVAQVTNRGGDRLLSWDGGAQSAVPRGSYGFEHTLSDDNKSAAARLNAGDVWPENDAGLAMRSARPVERTWIGASAPDGWRGRTGEEVIRDPPLLLGSSVVTLAAPADKLPPSAQESLVTYVRDLGGTLILRGGPNGFAAGGYTGTPIDAISPLASSPPEPTKQWILVVDASGSMAAAADGSTRFERAVDAMKSLIGNLPPHDVVQIGSIAEQFTPWGSAQPAGEMAKSAAPPAALTPRGPTNLEPFLESLAKDKREQYREIVIITDGEATFASPVTLGKSLQDAGVRVNVLMIGEHESAGIVAIVKAAGGQVAHQANASNWSAALRSLVRGMMGELMQNRRERISLGAPVNAGTVIESLNLTYDRDGHLLALTETDWPRPAAAEWRVGGGRVIALAFEADGGLIDRVAQAFAAPPRDPRFSVSVQTRDQVEIELNAEDQSRPMNQLRATLRPVGGNDSASFQQIAPGIYKATLPRANVPRTFDLLVDDQAIDRIALRPMHVREFDEIGLNRANLIALTERFGGAVIEADDTRPIVLPRRTTVRRIDAACAATAAILVLATLVYLRLL